ncbi:uncharacterized protein LOC116849958 [Odontomachus brunneus]|uniref:uncharacterized protein LOC116849958 n=1 Tax=Odontomachus brunneus TaxID=486640 RepID=UPI0013F18096|nr:uncharacterized protein LOC116849958 [Odontomachus brunneus]
MASLRERDTTVSQRQGNIPLEKAMETDNQLRSDDPQFAKVLDTCLKMEIAAGKKKLEANSMMIQKMRVKMRNEISKRKHLKEKAMQMQRVRVKLSESLTRLYISKSETVDTLDAMKANVDDQYKLIELRAQEYRDIIAEYKNSSDAYHAIYEEFPLAKARKAAKIKLRKLQIAHMVMTYEKTEIVTIIRQKRRIDWIRMRCKIIEFGRVAVQRLKLEEKLTRLKVNVDYHRRELRSIEIEMQVRHKKLEDQKRLRKQKMLEMAPPKINIPLRRMYAQAQTRTKVQHQWMQAVDTFDDTSSINTVVLEELCVNECIEVIDVESVQDKDPKCAIVQTESSNPKNPIIESTDPHIASVEPNIEANAAEEAASAENDVEMIEISQEETHRPHKPAKTRPSPRTKGNPLKHSAAESTQDEIEVKRMRLQRENSERSSSYKINVDPSNVVREDNAESTSHKSTTSAPTSVPKIRKIETVHYNVAVLPKPVPNGAESNVFSSPRYEFCESNIGFFDQDFTKGAASLYDGSLCNYQLSPVSNMSSICLEKEAPTALPINLLQQNDKNQSNVFDFNNYMKKEKNNYTLF